MEITPFRSDYYHYSTSREKNNRFRKIYLKNLFRQTALCYNKENRENRKKGGRTE